MIENLALGFSVIFSLQNLLYCFFGVLIGNIIGVLPGIGPLAAISMLLPITYGVEPTAAMLLLAGIYYGTSFGGAITAILLNLPGTASHAVVCLDGNPMARNGQGGSALFMAIFASFCGVSIGIVLMTLFTPSISRVALAFGGAEYFSLMALGLIAAAVITVGSPLKGIASTVIGLLLAVIGTDITSGAIRFTFGFLELYEGVSLVALAMGLFGIADVLATAGVLDTSRGARNSISTRSVRPGREDLKRSTKPILRGSAIGSFFGALPGTGGVIASFIAYAVEKKVSKTPSAFGSGAIEGIASPEAANSSADITAFIPTLTLGIPGSAVMALMLGALMIQNIQPGPQLIAERPELFWGLIASFWIGNIFLVILNVPMVQIWVKLLSVPYRFIFPVVVFLISVGVYSTSNNLFDVITVLLIGTGGFVAIALGFQPAPMLLGFVLGPMMEENFRRALLLSHGDLWVFLRSPISAVSLGVCLLLLVMMGFRRFASGRQKSSGADAARNT